MPRALIAGCGFVGLATARVLHALGWEVLGVTQSEESAGQLAAEAFQVLAADLTKPGSLLRLEHWRGCEAVIHCASSGRGGAEAYRAIYLGGARSLLQTLAPQSLLFTSSTSVYAQTDGEWVTEESLAEPERETGRILRETEELVISNRGCVARLAGIYGPGRSVSLRKFLSGEAVIEGSGSRWINQVHRDDIATALATLVQARASGLFNVADDLPLMQRELYGWLAAHYRKSLPPAGAADPNRKRGLTNKRVSNARLRALGWVPSYPSFQEAVSRDPDLAGPTL
jgi:nucleoside-diphosphate-sugar epimerase